VSYKTWFISKEPKLELELALTLFKTKMLVPVVSQNSETASFRVLVELKLKTLDEFRFVLL
jgi:hypothetical protein